MHRRICENCTGLERIAANECSGSGYRNPWMDLAPSAEEPDLRKPGMGQD